MNITRRSHFKYTTTLQFWLPEAPFVTAVKSGAFLRNLEELRPG